MTVAYIYGSPSGYSTLFGNTAGDDQIVASGYGNTIESGGANDQIYTGLGTALVLLGSFNNVTDSVNLTGAFNEVFAGTETDSSLTISGGNGNNFVDLSNKMGPNATAYNNVSLGGAYNTISLNGDAFNNVVAGSSYATVTIGFAGDGLFGYTPQVALAGEGNVVTGGDEAFNISGAEGTSTISLGNGNSRIEVAGPSNKIYLGQGSNIVTALSGHTSVSVTGPGYPLSVDTIKFGGTNNIVDSLTSATLAGIGAPFTPNAATLAAAAHVPVEGDEAFTITGGTGNSQYFLGQGLLNITTGGPNNTIYGLDHIDDTVTANGANNNVRLGNGSGDSITANGNADNVYVGTGTGDTVAASGNGDTITDGSIASTLTANGNTDTITYTGTGTLTATGSGDTISATPAGGGVDKITIGDNSFLTLTGSGVGTSVNATGQSDTVLLTGNASSEVNDNVSGGDLELALQGSGGAYTGAVVLDGLGSDPTAIVDLIGISGISSYGQLLAHASSDGSGGVLINLGSGGSLDLTHIVGGLTATEFMFNQPTTPHV